MIRLVLDISPALAALMERLTGPSQDRIIQYMGQRFDEIDAALKAAEAKQAEANAAAQQARDNIVVVVTGLKDQIAQLRTEIAGLKGQLDHGGLTVEEAAELWILLILLGAALLVAPGVDPADTGGTDGRTDARARDAYPGPCRYCAQLREREVHAIRRPAG